jgi:putative transcriptional regulator
VRNCLPALRGERGWTQADLAAAVGVSRQTIVSIERGRFDPSLPLAFSLARCFGRPIEELFSFDVDGEEPVICGAAAHQ